MEKGLTLKRLLAVTVLVIIGDARIVILLLKPTQIMAHQSMILTSNVGHSLTLK
jgi:hypothetical protein